MPIGPPPRRGGTPDFGPPRPIPPPDLDDIVTHAFRTCTNRLSYTPTDGEWRDTKMFILDGERYTSLKGRMAVPTSHWSNPSQDLDKLTNTLNDIRNHCTNFNRNSMAKFGTFTDDIIGFCDDMSKYIAGENLLQDQIKILSNAHASLIAGKLACAKAKNILDRLSSAAERHQASCLALVSDVVLFQGLTSADLIAIKQVEQMLDTTTFNNLDPRIIWLFPGTIFDDMGPSAGEFIRGLEANMENAVTGLRSTQATLARLQSDFSALAEYFDSIWSWLDDKDPVVRSLAEVDLDASVSKWWEIRTLAQHFQKTIANPKP